MVDYVNHPPHYMRGKIEAIEVIEDWKLGYHLGNTIKYLCRAGLKDSSKEIEDLKKAHWYLTRYLESKTRDEQDGELAGPLGSRADVQ